MANILKTSFLGTTRKLPSSEQLKKLPKIAGQGCLFAFYYRSKGATDPHPFIIMVSPKWVSKKGTTYFTGINLNTFDLQTRRDIVSEFGHLPVGSVSYNDIKEFSKKNPNCCVRTYNVNKVRALHKIEI